VAEVDITLADWWQEFSMADDATREDLVHQAKAERPKPVARRAPRPVGEEVKSPSTRRQVDEATSPGEGFEAAPSDAAKKRRRRRRKPGGAEGSAPAGQD
jgi:poly(A) polymerase